MSSPPFKRILLKLSGEVLMGNQQFGIDPEFVAELAAEVKAAKETGLEICLVIGGGNIFRGMAGAAAVALLGVLIIRLWFLQVTGGQDYAVAAQQNARYAAEAGSVEQTAESLKGAQRVARTTVNQAASGVNVSVNPSVPSRATYCFTRAFLG